MKINKYIGMTMMVAGVLAASSCTDFDDYNEVGNISGEGNAELAGQTLLENIRNNSQLSDFYDLLKQSGFDENLNTTHCYTVWAPVNGTFDKEAYQSLSKQDLLKQLIKNHIAESMHRATGTVNERMLMLNEKKYDFEGTGGIYTFDGVAIDSAQCNLPNSNGVLHILKDQAVTWYPNLYEYLMDSLLNKDEGIDILRHYYQINDTTYLDRNASIAGSIVDGMQTYVDSVMVTENELWGKLKAYVEREDSSYTFLMPTNKAWTEAYDTIKRYFNYIPNIVAENAEGTAIYEINGNIEDVEFKRDEITTQHIANYLAYSNNDVYNKWVEGEPTVYGNDTLRTTLGRKFSNPREILGQTIKTIKTSNGTGHIVDSLAFYRWETFAPELSISAANNQLLVKSGRSYVERVEKVDSSKVDVSELTGTYSYLVVTPTTTNGKPELDVLLPDVLSTTYDIYCIFVPENVDTRYPDAVTLPNRVIFELSYCDANGKLQSKVFLDESEENINNFKEQFPNVSDSGTANKNTIRGFSNDTSKVDTVYVGEFTFPVCYYGLRDLADKNGATDPQFCPNIKITTPFQVTNTTLKNAFTREMRIAGILLKPKELVEFEESNKK